MLVFGTTVTGVDPSSKELSLAEVKKRKKKRKAERMLVKQLEHEERELAYKLESTRGRLKNYMDKKKKQAEEADAGFSVYHAIVPGSSTTKALESIRGLKESKSVTSPRMLPILTRTGQAPFEVGMDESGGHVLPIFQLPKVQSATKIVNPLPKQVVSSDSEKKRLKEEEEERLQALLGFTEEEARFLEKAKMGEAKDSVTKRGNTERAKLGKQLKKSLKKVESITSIMGREISQIIHSVPEGVEISSKSKRYMLKWGFAKIEHIFAGFQNKQLSNGMQTWKAYIQAAKEHSRQEIYNHVKGSVKLVSFFKNLENAKLAKGFNKWRGDVAFAIANEGFLLETSAAITIQRVFRGRKGRTRAKRCRNFVQSRRQTVAATKLQSMFRGRLGKTKAHEQKERQKMNRAAIRLQRTYRMRLAKRRAIARRIDLENMGRAALKVQTAWRCKKGQMGYQLLQQAKRNKAASKLQAIQRKRQSVKTTSKMRMERKQTRACVMLQRQFRARLAREKVRKRRHEVKTQREQEEMAALRIQARYRAHRGTLVVQLKRQAKLAAQEADSKQVSKIQSMFRGKLGRRKATQRRVEAEREWCAAARSWLEQPEGYFFNKDTHEILHEPPPEGYVRTDTKLALFDGRVIEDPLVVEKRERDKNLRPCVECEEVAATRTCNECEDVFCDECYETIHFRGKLASHTFEWFQNGNQETEQQQLSESISAALTASLTASQGNDAPGGGWEEIFDEETGMAYYYHAESGTTSWEKPEETPEWEEYFDEAGGYSYWFNPLTGETTWENPLQASHHHEEHSGEWEEHFDEAANAPYYYNPSTGESTYDKPY